MTMADKITVTLNGKKAQGSPGTTILDLARENGVEIPTLCYHSSLPSIGACRVCVVEVEGVKNLVGSCHTPIHEGMVIKTHSPRVLEARRVILELLLSSHSGECLFCSKANVCELRKLAAESGIAVSRFMPKKRFFSFEQDSTYIVTV